MMKYLPVYLLGLSVLLLFSACENDINEVRRFGYYEEVPTEVAKDVEMLYSDSLQVRVRVRAPELVRYGGSKLREEFNEGLEVDFLSDNLQVSSRLTAKSAVKKTITVRDEKGRASREPVVIVRDSVVLVSGNGKDILKTDELIWYENSDKLASDAFVTIIKPDQVIYGFGFDSDGEFGTWRIRSVAGKFDKGSFDP